MNVIKKIFLGETDENMHSDFVKFGKGVFENRYLLEGKKQKDRWNIKTSAEFVNFLVRKCLEDSSGKIKVGGIIVYTFDIKNDINFPIENVKQFMGIKQIVINTEVEPEKIISLMNKHPRAFYALSFASNGCELKIKAKAPKSAKPSASGEKEAKANFCSLKTSNKNIVDDLFFDFPDFKEIKANHTITIDEIVLPKDEKDPVKIRENAKRKGTIKRKVVVDGKEFIKEAKFEA